MSTLEAKREPENGFAIVWREVIRRTKKPKSQVVYWNHFMISVCVFGGGGILLELGRFIFAKEATSAAGILTAMATFFPATIGSSAMQIMFDQENDRRLRSISNSMMVLTFLVSGFLILTADPTSCIYWITASIFCLFSLWVWWIANADNLGLYDNPPIDAATGGSDPTVPLKGDTSGFQV